MNTEDKLWLVCFAGSLHHKCTRIGEGKRCNLSCTACMEQILPASGVGLPSTLLYNIYTYTSCTDKHGWTSAHTQREEVDGGGYTGKAGEIAAQHTESCNCCFNKLVLPYFCRMNSTGQGGEGRDGLGGVGSCFSSKNLPYFFLSGQMGNPFCNCVWRRRLHRKIKLFLKPNKNVRPCMLSHFWLNSPQ